MKCIAVQVVLISAIAITLSACASHDLATDQSMQSTGTVPGEKVDGSSVAPGVGPSGASANVHW